MKKQTGLTLVEMLISAGLAIIVLGGGFYLYTSLGEDEVENIRTEESDATSTQENETFEEDTTEISTTTENISDTPTREENDNRQVYKNEEYGFEIKYPSNLEWGGKNSAEKSLFSLSNQSEDISYEFWIQKLDGKTLEQVFEEKLKLDNLSYFDWIRDQGGEVSSEDLGENTWIFIDGSSKLNLTSAYLVLIPGGEAYLIVDLGLRADKTLELTRSILSTLRFTN